MANPQDDPFAIPAGLEPDATLAVVVDRQRNVIRQQTLIIQRLGSIEERMASIEALRNVREAQLKSWITLVASLLTVGNLGLLASHILEAVKS